MMYKCSEYGSLMFKEKSNKAVTSAQPSAKFSLCCSYGQVKLAPIKESSEMLKGLLTGSNKRDQDFCKNIRAYNSSLAFASMLLSGNEHKFKTKGPYCYCINGQIYHALNQMQPEYGKSQASPKSTHMTKKMN